MNNHAMFFDSKDGDRKYNAEDFREWMRNFFTTGVGAKDLFVEAIGNRKVSVGAGYVNINGGYRFFDDPTEFTIDPPAAGMNRVDNVVAELNASEDVRNIILKIVKGDNSSDEAVPKDPAREGNVYQLVVARIYVMSGSTDVTQGYIQDTRGYSDLCGFSIKAAEKFDMSEFLEEHNDYFKRFVTENIGEFMNWFSSIRDIADENFVSTLGGMISDATSRLAVIQAKLPVIEADIDELEDKFTGLMGGYGSAALSFHSFNELCNYMFGDDGVYPKYKITHMIVAGGYGTNESFCGDGDPFVAVAVPYNNDDSIDIDIQVGNMRYFPSEDVDVYDDNIFFPSIIGSKRHAHVGSCTLHVKMSDDGVSYSYNGVTALISISFGKYDWNYESINIESRQSTYDISRFKNDKLNIITFLKHDTV